MEIGAVFVFVIYLIALMQLRRRIQPLRFSVLFELLPSTLGLFAGQI